MLRLGGTPLRSGQPFETEQNLNLVNFLSCSRQSKREEKKRKYEAA